jgi:integrase
MALNKTRVEAAAAQDKPYWLPDGLVPGFGLMVLPSGAKTYYLRYRTIAGTTRTYKIGRDYQLLPDQARKLARDALAQVREGKDPAAEVKALRKAATLADLRDRYMEEHGERKRSAGNDRGYWKNHILQGLGERTKVQLLTHEQVRLWHLRHPKPTTANRALEVLSKAMDMAEAWGARPKGTNPCRGIKAHAERKRVRYLSPDELAGLRSGLILWDQHYGTGSIRWRFAQLVRLLLLTGARLANIMEARWAWVNWERGLLVVPPEDHKTGGTTQEPLLIQLGPRALEILRELQRAQNFPSPFVVHGDDPGKPLNGYRKMWLQLIADSGLGHLRVHDLRHHFASAVLSDGHELAMVGALLGHQSPTTTARYAHLMDQVAKKVVGGVADGLGI